MTSHFLLLNPDISEVMLLGLQHVRNTLSILPLNGIALTFSTTDENPGVDPDQDIPFNAHIQKKKLQGMNIFTKVTLLAVCVWK